MSLTLKKIKEFYHVFKLKNGTYSIYDNHNLGKRVVKPYLCSLEREKRNFKVVGGETICKNIKTLKSEIQKKIKSYEFDSEYYDPLFRDGYLEEVVIHDYLIDRGFNLSEGYKTYTTYTYKQQNVYKGKSASYCLTFCGLDCFTDKLPEEVTVLFKTGEWSWVEVKCKRNVTSIIKTIDSLLKPVFVGDSVKSLEQGIKFKAEEFLGQIKQLKGLDTISQEYKNTLREELTKLLKYC